MIRRQQPQYQQVGTDDQGFANYWNSLAAQNWNARDRGEDPVNPNFATALSDYNFQRELSSAPMGDRLAYRKFQQDAIQDQYANERNQMIDQRTMQSARFNQWSEMERLKLAQEAARRASMGKAVDPMDVMRERSGLVDVSDPISMLDYFDRTPDAGNVYEFADSYGMKRTKELPEYYINDMRALRDQIYPGVAQNQMQQRMTSAVPNATGAASFLRGGHGSLPAQAAVQASRPTPLSTVELARLEELRRKMAQGAIVSGNPQDFAAPN